MELYVDIEKNFNEFGLKTQFEVKDVEPLALLGASGSGKSMTLRCIAGLETPTRGTIALDGKILFDSKKKINLPSQKRKTGFLFQDYALFPHMTVEENIGFALNKISKKERKDIIEEKIRMIRLEGLEKRYPSQLSGGQQQRVALARALAVEPEVLLLDEPFSALDNYLRSRMEKQLIEILSDFKGITLFVTHNMDEAYRVCNQLLVFSEGTVAAQGEKESIFRRPPNYSTAQLTGCKNISKAVQISDNKVEAIEWGCQVEVEDTVPEDLAYIGIRAHYLQITKDNQQPNTFPFRIRNASETPFSVTVYISLRESNSKGYDLQWEMSKEQWGQIKDSEDSLYVQIQGEKLFMTSN